MLSKSTGNVTTVVGYTGSGCTYSGDGSPTGRQLLCRPGRGSSRDGGAATAATLNGPTGLAIDAASNLFIADFNNNVVRRVDAMTGTITTVAGNSTTCSPTTATCGDGGSATSANLANPVGVAVDTSRNPYIADVADYRVRKISSSNGNIATFAGTSSSGYSGDDGAATSAKLNHVYGVAVDSAGNVYNADPYNQYIRLVNASSGNINSIAGNGSTCSSSTATCGDGGTSASASVHNHIGVFIDSSDNLYIADFLDNRVRQVNATSLSFTFASTPANTTSSDSPKTVNVLSAGNAALTFPVPASGGNPSVATHFGLSGSSTCPVLTHLLAAQARLPWVACVRTW